MPYYPDYVVFHVAGSVYMEVGSVCISESFYASSILPLYMIFTH